MFKGAWFTLLGLGWVYWFAWLSGWFDLVVAGGYLRVELASLFGLCCIRLRSVRFVRCLLLGWVVMRCLLLIVVCCGRLCGFCGWYGVAACVCAVLWVGFGYIVVEFALFCLI